MNFSLFDFSLHEHMKYKIIKNLAITWMVWTALFSFYFLANFSVSIYGFISKKSDVINDLTLHLLPNNLTSKILFCVFSLLLCLVSVIAFRVLQITKSWCEYNIVEKRNELFGKKHPTALDKIKSIYPNNPEKWQSYARGEFRENNGVYIYNETLAAFNAQDRIENQVPLSNMLKDFLLVAPFSKPYYRQGTFPNHRSYQQYMEDKYKEAGEVLTLRGDLPVYTPL